ncbi:MAG: 4-(cytidine 5'-diphospho)-2-C-methyl-D-erythritol kinase [Proteobacteria bacterium]|nr:4-(cytidine 5'-diphospho)-2-C-methyl-D-erythritol kinase [Pseudomonadota bacterium]
MSPTLDLTLRAPAKINLSLRVLGRRADGYHELDSVFVPLSLADTIELRCEPATRTTITCVCPEHPELDGLQNLAARAAQRYLDAIGVRAAVGLRLTKRIWAAAGLGGGSSDGAAVLRALDAHHAALGAGMAPAALAALALELGADLPFFLQPRVARARGVGEALTPFSGLPPLHLVLLNPGLPLPTAAVYAALGLARGERAPTPPTLVPPTGSLTSVLPWITNDLEAPAIRLCPPVADLKRLLHAAGAHAASMTGSGPTVFGLFESADRARAVAAELAVSAGIPALAVRAGELDSEASDPL